MQSPVPRSAIEMEEQPIWFSQPTPELLAQLSLGNMVSHCGIVVTTIGHNSLSATMPHSPATIQPYGYMHGGAYCVLAETLGSFASAMLIDLDKFHCVGTEINASHLRSVKSGIVTGTCKPLRIGRSQHVWQIDITNESGELVSACRLTVVVLPK